MLAAKERADEAYNYMKENLTADRRSTLSRSILRARERQAYY